MIPEEKKSAVEKALQATFGITEIEAISELTAGLSSAVVYRIVVHGKPYVLRIIMRDEVIGSLPNQYACMRAAAEAGIAPRVWYTGMEDKISITDFIEPKPFPLPAALVKFPALLKVLHSLPAFPAQVNYLDVMDRLVKRFEVAKMLSGDISEEVFRKYEEIVRIYPRNSEDLVSCHNDTKADNIIYDGERPWLVDWESAFLNDRYLDLAIVANFVVWNDADEKEFLYAYFGRPASNYQRARFFLMRQLLHMFYIAFLLSGPNSPPMPDPELCRQGFRAFHELLWAGKMNIGNRENRQQYALVHLDQLRHNLKIQRLEDSLRVVGEEL